MQSGGWRRCGTYRVGINRLVALFIRKFFCNIWRKRHLSDFIKHVINIAFVLKSYYSVSLFNYINNFRFKKASAEYKPFSDFGMFARTYKNFPYVKILLFKKKKFYRRMGVFSFADKPCRNNTGIVQYKKISRFQKVYNIIKMLVFNFTGFSVKMHKPGMVALIRRMLRNKLFRKVKIKITCFHQITNYHNFCKNIDIKNM